MDLRDMQMLARNGHAQQVYDLFGMTPERPFVATRSAPAPLVTVELFEDVDDRYVSDGRRVRETRKMPRRQGIYTQSAESVATGVRDLTRGGKNKARLVWPDTKPHFGPLTIRSAS